MVGRRLTTGNLRKFLLKVNRLVQTSHRNISDTLFNYVAKWVLESSLKRHLTQLKILFLSNKNQNFWFKSEASRKSFWLHNTDIKRPFFSSICHNIPDSLRVQASQIFLFQLTSKNEIIAHLIGLFTNDPTNPNQNCSYYGYFPNDFQMNVCKQIFIKCPTCLIVSF